MAHGQVLDVSAPANVVSGRAFNVEYRIDLAVGTIDVPDFQGFDLLAGPSVSTSSSVTMINGKTTSQTTSFYTFTLRGREAGVFTIPAATVTADGKNYASKPQPIEVVDEGEEPAANGRTASQAGQDIFMRAIVDRAAVWKGEPVRVVFKLYSRHPSFEYQVMKMPSLNGFWAERLDVSHYKSQTENYNSSVYHTLIVDEYLLFPLQSGTLKIDPLPMNLVIQQVDQTRERSLEDLIYGRPPVVETRRSVASPTVEVTVKELPADAPKGFVGAVGNFTLTSVPPEKEISANAGATYRIKIAGTGNFPQIAAPAVVMPDSFEALNTKTIDETHPSGRGITGTKQFEYPFVARGEGSYRIEPVEFSYFDPQRGRYITLTTPEARLDVSADTLSGGSAATIVGGVTQRELEILNRDIRFIKHDAPGLRPRGRAFAFSWGWFAMAAAMAAAFALMFIYLRKHIERLRDVDLMRGRRAHKVVHARLRAASEYMKEGNDRRFHNEMLKALWGYMGDKLNIPAANLTKENIRERLEARDVPGELTGRYINLISECESAQYSPGESASPGEIYRTAADVISKIERYFK